MGAEGYMWVTRYQKSLAKALDMARRETFAAGKFLGAEKKPVSIVAAMAEVAEEGTGSLLDIMRVSKIPELCSVCSVSAKERKDFFGTEHPDGSEIAGAMAFWESFDRGMARAVTLYEQGRPVKICFAGWTLDAPAMGNGSYEEVDERNLPPPEKKVQTESDKVFGMWVGAMGGDHEGLPVFLRLHGDVLWKVLFKPFSEELRTLVSFLRMMDKPESIRCGRFREILESIAHLVESQPCHYSLSVKPSAVVANCGMSENEEVRYMDETKRFLTTISAGYDFCRLKKEQVQYEYGKYCNVVAVVEERDLRGERDVPLGNGIVKIAQRKIPPILEREHLSALQEVLSKCDQDIYLKFCANEWPLKNGQPVLPDWSDETTIERAWTDFTHEERVKELAFFKECLKLMEKGKLRPEMPEWKVAKTRCIAIDNSFSCCPEFMAESIEYGEIFSCLVLGKMPPQMSS